MSVDAPDLPVTSFLVATGAATPRTAPAPDAHRVCRGIIDRRGELIAEIIRDLAAVRALNDALACHADGLTLFHRIELSRWIDEQDLQIVNALVPSPLPRKEASDV